MAITKYQNYHKKIVQILEIIRNKYHYKNLSMAFAHWYLQYERKLNDEEIQEAIIDGSYDMGIDAVIIDEDSKKLTVFQFKFPNKDANITLEIQQDEILKTFYGFNILYSSDIPYNGKNKSFGDKKDTLKEIYICNCEIYFVSFNKGIITHKDLIENENNKFKAETGNELKVIVHEFNHISNIYDRINRENNVEIDFVYETVMPISGDMYQSFYCYTKATNLIETIGDKMSLIFDENIRLYEYDTEINKGIKDTATGNNSKMFYFYNNGIVFICDKINNSSGNRKISLKGASVVNGCQTLNALYEIKERLKDDVFLMIKIIEISDYDERANITKYLNSQNQIKDSYFLANHTLIRQLQKELLEKGYFLERQKNEYKYKKYEENVKIITLEEAIQYYVGCHIDRYAYLAKNSKKELFDENRIDEILKHISAEKVISAYELHLMIGNILTKYRRLRKNSESKEFSEFIGISMEELNQGEEFKFLNTADILLLNIVRNYLDKFKNTNKQEAIKQSIFKAKQVIDKYKSNSVLANLTRKKEIYDEIRNIINNQNS